MSHCRTRFIPNALLCGSGGVGTPAHFGCELLRLRGNAYVPGFGSESWWGAFAPAGTPAPLVRRLGVVIAGIVPEPQSRERFAALGIEPLGLSPAELAAWVRSELATYGKIVKDVGIAGQ